mmetsp:Transcript_1093/g.2959  ORF Transcript_1093/g.2959 Transcript_1093/m.2959 type:complete len:220 (+) Transcript_1093:588-1247(+)
MGRRKAVRTIACCSATPTERPWSRSSAANPAMASKGCADVFSRKRTAAPESPCPFREAGRESAGLAVLMTAAAPSRPRPRCAGPRPAGAREPRRTGSGLRGSSAGRPAKRPVPAGRPAGPCSRAGAARAPSPASRRCRASWPGLPGAGFARRPPPARSAHPRLRAAWHARSRSRAPASGTRRSGTGSGGAGRRTVRVCRCWSGRPAGCAARAACPVRAR